MFFRQISDFEDNFKFLDRLNVLLFNVWKDDNADAYKIESMDQLEMFYRNYVNEMRQKSHEMSNLLRDINEKISELSKITDELRILQANSEIHGCRIGIAYGPISEHSSGTEYFIIAKGEMNDDMKSIARSRCVELLEVKTASCQRML